jgi:L-ascorbate metabolism protein UlaG (beta-lactamase superfamily)
VNFVVLEQVRVVFVLMPIGVGEVQVLGTNLSFHALPKAVRARVLLLVHWQLLSA